MAERTAEAGAQSLRARAYENFRQQILQASLVVIRIRQLQQSLA